MTQKVDFFNTRMLKNIVFSGCFFAVGVSCRTRTFQESKASSVPAIAVDDLDSIGNRIDDLKRKYTGPDLSSSAQNDQKVRRAKSKVDFFSENFQTKMKEIKNSQRNDAQKIDAMRTVSKALLAEMKESISYLASYEQARCVEGFCKRFTAPGDWQEIYSTDLIPPPPSIDRAKVYQYYAEAQSPEQFRGFPTEGTAEVQKKWISELREVCPGKVPGGGDVFLWHYAVADHPLMPSKKLTFFLGALGSEVRGIYSGFTYCVSTIMEGELSPKTPLEELTTKLTAVGFKKLKSDKVKINVSGLDLNFSPAPDLPDFLKNFKLPFREAGGFSFPGPIGLSAVLADVFSDADMKITVGFDLRKPDDELVWVFRKVKQAAPEKIGEMVALQDTLLKAASLQGSELNADEVCPIKQGQKIAISEIQEFPEEKSSKISIYGDLTCKNLGRSVFVFSPHFEKK